jgi:hypothetical protein
MKGAGRILPAPFFGGRSLMTMVTPEYMREKAMDLFARDFY